MPALSLRLPIRARAALIAATSILGGLLLMAPAASAAIKVAWSSSGNLSRLHDELESIYCPSEHVCIGKTANEHLAWSNNPSSGASWHVSGGRRRIHSVSCEARICMASEGSLHGFNFNLYVSEHPQGGLASFTRVASATNFEMAEAISCPVTSFCAALDAGENAWVSLSPGRPGSWHRIPGPRNRRFAYYDMLTCPSSLVCLTYATAANTEMVGVLKEPANPRSSWTFTNADPATGVTNKYCFAGRSCWGEQFTGGSCIAPAACLLTTGYGAIVTSPDIEASASSWTRTVIYGSGTHRRGYYGLSDPICFSVSLCYVLGAQGDLLASAAPFSSDPSAWQVIHIPKRRVPTAYAGRRTLSCPSAQVCFVLVNGGHGQQVVLRGEVAGS